MLGDEETPFELNLTCCNGEVDIFSSSDPSLVNVLVSHGATDAPAVDIWANDDRIISNLFYDGQGTFFAPIEVPAADYILGVAPTGSDIIAAFSAPLSGLGGGSAFVFASGFLSGADDDPAFGLFAALTDGTVLTLPAVEQDCAGEWGGSAVVDCAGECGGSAVVDCAGECGGSADFDCAGQCGGSAELDACGECDGGEIDPNNCFEINTLWMEWNGDDGLDVYMYNEEPVAGFQFDLSGITLSSATGGSAADAGFTVNASGSTVLGFSFSGATIPAGNTLLTSVTFTVNEGEIQSCLEDVVMSDSGANALEFNLGDCVTVISLSGCTDESACNYSELANEDDGSCWYVGVDNDYCDCDMNVVDCLGECGGSAVEDCAGVCDGDSVVDCLGECGGSAVADCAGECNGDAQADACGECNGSETDPNNCFEDNTLWMSLNEDGNIDVYMYNITPVAGFQFDITSDLDGFTLNGASGGLASTYFDAVQTAGPTVLGFSFSGAVIPEGLGVLTTLDVDFGDDPNGFVYLDSPVFSDAAADEIVFDIFEELMIGTPPYVSVSLQNVTNFGAEIHISSTTDIAGFQFDLTSVSDGFEVLDAVGGLATDAGFTISANQSGTVVGFSLTGATIPASDGVLVNLEYNFNGSFAILDLDNVIFSDSDADPIPYGVDGDEVILGELPPVPNAPEGLSATLDNLVDISLSWNASEYAEFYTVYRNGQSILDTDDLAFNDNGLEYSTEYVYWVTASNLMGESGSSNEVSVITDSEPFDPIPPSDLTAEAGDEQVQLSWNPPSAGGGSFPACPDGSMDYEDCAGVCFNNADCASGGYDCCVDDGNC